MLARDGGTPVKTSTAIVDVTVIRNLNQPRFTQSNMRVSINDNIPAGSSIIQVEATDDDDEVGAWINVSSWWYSISKSINKPISQSMKQPIITFSH